MEIKSATSITSSGRIWRKATFGVWDEESRKATFGVWDEESRKATFGG